MGFWSDLFGIKKKQPVFSAKKQVKRRPLISRTSDAVMRLAHKRRCSIYDINLYDDSIVEELLLFGLILNDDGLNYIDDPNWVDEDTMIDNITAEDTGTLIEDVPEPTSNPGWEPLPEKEPVIEAIPEAELPAPPETTYEPPKWEPPSYPEPERSWTSESSGSSWSSDSGGSDFGGGGSDD